ncbi:hypothetical protein [Nostoc sp.]
MIFKEKRPETTPVQATAIVEEEFRSQNSGVRIQERGRLTHH